MLPNPGSRCNQRDLERGLGLRDCGLSNGGDSRSNARRAAHCNYRRLREVAKEHVVICAEGIGLRGEKLQQTDDGIIYLNRNRNNGAYPQSAAALLIYARIGFTVVTAQQSSRANTLARES